MNAKNSTQPAEPHYAVLSPLSRKNAGTTAAAPRLADLNDKTVCEIWDGIFRGETIYPLVREHIRGKFPRVRFVDPSAFGNFYGARDREILSALPEKLKAHGVDAAIVGIGA
jgi:hypothetical protein